MSKSKNIQQIRAFSVIAVVIFHTKAQFLPNGFLGVDAFFVVSGYLIIPKVLDIFSDKDLYRIRFVEFFKDRIRRLAPALITTIFGTFVIFLFFGNIGLLKGLVEQGIASVLMFSNFLAFQTMPNYFDPVPNPLLHIWSLSLESQYYLFLPLLFLPFKHPRILLLNILGCFSFVFFLHAFWNQNSTEFPSLSNFSTSYYSPFLHFWEFYLGYLVLRLRKYVQIKSNNLFKLSLVVISFTLMMSHANYFFGILSAVFITGLSLLLEESKKTNSISVLLERIGNASYSIYLVHFPLLILAKSSPLIVSYKARISATIIAFILTFVLGHLSFALIERRFRRTENMSKPIFKIILASMVLLVFLSAALFSQTQILQAAKSGTHGSRSYYLDNYRECETLPTEWLCKQARSMNNTKESKTVLLVGDSHAGSISLATLNFIEDDKKEFYIRTLPGCYFNFSNPKMLSYLKSYTIDCKHQNQLVKDIINSKNGGTLILSQRQSRFYVGDDLNNVSNFVRERMIDLSAIQKLGWKILVVGPIPELYNYSLVESFFANKWDGIPELESRMVASALKNSRIFYLDSVRVLCGAGKCNQDSLWRLYWDSDHLNAYGSRILAQQISAKLFN